MLSKEDIENVEILDNNIQEETQLSLDQIDEKIYTIDDFLNNVKED